MASAYFTPPAVDRAKQHQDELERSSPQQPILKEQDEAFLKEHVANDEAPAGMQNVATTKIADDGKEIDASMSDQIQVDQPSDLAVLPETRPEDGNVETTQHSVERSYDDIMREKAAERVQARKAKKRRTLDLPSQEEAEAATKGFNDLAAQHAENAQNERKTWLSYLTSIIPSSRPSSQPDGEQQQQQSEGSATPQRTWKDYASSYVPSIPASWKPGSKSTSKPDSRSASPVYKEDGTIDEERTREKEEREVSVLLDKLSLSQINNRVFSFSTDTQKIYERFAQVLKDTINGGPTAYEDMETLMREAGPKLEQQFKAMPPFVQSLVKSLPAKFGATLGPEILAAASEKPGADMQKRLDLEGKEDGKEKSKKKKKKRRIPGLKSLLSKEGAVASMLRNVVTFLQTRFPFLASTTSVAMSLAVFILMFVFWYCHKRGKQVRLAKEAEDAAAAEKRAEEEEDDDDTVEDDDDDGDGDDDNEEQINEEDEKYQALLKDVESKADTLSEPYSS